MSQSPSRSNNCARSQEHKLFTSFRRILICFSGKRKSGKDYVASKLANFLSQELAACGINCQISVVGISYLLKEEFAQLNGLDAEKLKSDGVYKETVRAKMVVYGEKIRSIDSDYFCRKAFEGALSKENNTKLLTRNALHIIIVSDCRRPSDLSYFHTMSHFNFDSKLCKTSLLPGIDVDCSKVLFVRINAADETRQKRGFVFTSQIDDAETECALDAFDGWHVIIQNDGNSLLLQNHFQAISTLLLQRV